jgi:hypothetical protein
VILTTIAIVAQASTALAPQNIDATAQAWFAALVAGKLLDPTALDAEERRIFTPAHTAAFAGDLRKLGAPTLFKRELVQSGSGAAAYAYRVAFADGTTTLFNIVVRGDKISGLAFAPAPDTPHIRAWYDALASGKLLDENEMSAEMRKGMTAATLLQVRNQLESRGTPTAFELFDVRKNQGSTSFAYKVSYASGDALVFIFSKAPDGKVDGLWFKPATP